MVAFGASPLVVGSEISAKAFRLSGEFFFRGKGLAAIQQGNQSELIVGYLGSMKSKIVDAEGIRDLSRRDLIVEGAASRSTKADMDAHV